MNWIKHLYVQVLLGILLGISLGYFFPEIAVWFKPLMDAFVKLIKMLIAPIIFLSLVSGIASMTNMKEVGEIGGAAILYFMLMTVLALSIGLLVANTLKPGAGLMIDLNSLDKETVKHYVSSGHDMTNLTDFFLNIIPRSFFSPFVDGEILQVLFIAILFSAGLMISGVGSAPILSMFQRILSVFFKMIHLIMHVAPLAAFAAMAFCIGKYGLAPLLHMLKLLLCFYGACAVFVLLILGGLLKWYCDLNVFKVIAYFKTEMLIVLGTSSSETVLPVLMEKLEWLGCDKSVVGLAIPLGYSFNLDGTAIYLTLAALFIAQALHVDLSVWQQLSLLLVMIISSKGAAGVVGSGFIVLASSLAATGHVPVEGIVLILGIDIFMSEGRALTNMLGNCISTIILSTWQKNFDRSKADWLLRTRPDLD